MSDVPPPLGDRATIQAPRSGLIAMRIATEFGSPEQFAETVERAMARGGDRGAMIVAALDRGDLSIRIPREDAPSWNQVPLVRLRRGEQPGDDAWAVATAIIEKLERYR
jgi:hypothetical protein